MKWSAKLDNSKMPTRRSFSRTCFSLAFMALNGVPSRAQRPLTPEVVERIRSLGASSSEFQGLFFQGSSTPRAGYSLGLSYGSAEPAFELRGTTVTNTPVIVSLSDVELITYFGGDGQHFRFRVARYDISSKELLDNKPNYTQLREHFKTIELLVPVRDAKGAGLFWMGRTSRYNETERLGSVDQTASNKAIRLSLPPTATWWAIPSVVNDPLCPIKGLSPLGDSGRISKE